MKKYSFDSNPEHKNELKPWADKWIKNALNTDPLSDEDKSIARKAVKEMYDAAGIEAPPENRIVFVDSPFVGRFSAGFAAAIWYNRKTGRKSTGAAIDDATCAATCAATYASTYAATCDATDVTTYASTRAATDAATDAAAYAATYAATCDSTRDATRDATDVTTYASTRAATYDAIYAATDDATRDATHDATHDAIDDATYAATDAAIHAATRDATRDATYAATRASTDDAAHDATCDLNKWYKFPVGQMSALSEQLGLGEFGMKCSQSAWRFYQGSQYWSGYIAFLSFFRHVARLKIDYSKFDCIEKLAMHGGSIRFVHEKFCILVNRPKYIKQDSQNRPHCEDGPFCEWRDGSAMYAIHGVRVPAWAVLTPRDQIKTEDALNLDHRQKEVVLSFDQWIKRGYVVADGICKKLRTIKTVGNVDVFECDDDTVMVKRGDLHAHGDSVEQAIKDLRYKIGNRDTSEFESWREDLNQEVSFEDAVAAYRTVTGACEFGVKEFVESIEVPDKLTPNVIIKLTEGRFGSDQFREFLKV